MRVSGPPQQKLERMRIGPSKPNAGPACEKRMPWSVRRTAPATAGGRGSVSKPWPLWARRPNIGRELGQPPEWFDRLRNEAIAALALPDIHITQEFGAYRRERSRSI